MLHALFLFWIAISHLYSFLLEPVLASHTTICLHKILFRSIRSTSGEIVMATIYHIFNYHSGNQYHHVNECKTQRQRLVKHHKIWHTEKSRVHRLLPKKFSQLKILFWLLHWINVKVTYAIFIHSQWIIFADWYIFRIYLSYIFK